MTAMGDLACRLGRQLLGRIRTRVGFHFPLGAPWGDGQVVIAGPNGAGKSM